MKTPLLSNLPPLKLPITDQSSRVDLSLVAQEDRQFLSRLGISHFSLQGVHAPALLTALREHAQTHCFSPASLSGYDLPPPGQDVPEDSAVRIGSLRIRCFDTTLARLLYTALQTHVLPYLLDEAPDKSPDLDGHGHWKFAGVNPLFRFIRYPANTGTLVAHYDAPYVANSQERTLYSLLVYLSDCEQGSTRFLKDPQADISQEKRVFQDWPRVGLPHEVLASVSCKMGDVIVFPHRLLHDSEPNTSEKIVMRSDLLFQKVF